jgi:uncharacterized metal-binding protein
MREVAFVLDRFVSHCQQAGMPSASQKSEEHANSLVFALIAVNHVGQVVVTLTVQLMVKTVMEPLMSLSVAVTAGAELG